VVTVLIIIFTTFPSTRGPQSVALRRLAAGFHTTLRPMEQGRHTMQTDATTSFRTESLFQIKINISDRVAHEPMKLERTSRSERLIAKGQTRVFPLQRGCNFRKKICEIRTEEIHFPSYTERRSSGEETKKVRRVGRRRRPRTIFIAWKGRNCVRLGWQV